MATKIFNNYTNANTTRTLQVTGRWDMKKQVRPKGSDNWKENKTNAPN
jgi:hypothetical protein